LAGITTSAGVAARRCLSLSLAAQGYEVQLEVDWGLAVKLGVALIARSGGTVFQVYSGAGISERNYHL